MSKTTKPRTPLVPTSNYVSHYDPAKSHHRAWLQAVLDRLVALDSAALVEGSELRDLWKAAVETKHHRRGRNNRPRLPMSRQPLLSPSTW